ncbi:glycosyltransferase family 52 [Fusobacterium mortiferum]|uniref:glycosyltransferase family 52 n=1 Tax=Fusobacterium mortiferum TaxID=850 RepID=UPI003564BF85
MIYKKIFSGANQYQLLQFLLIKNSKDIIHLFILPEHLYNVGRNLSKRYNVIYFEKDPGLKKIIKHIKYYLKIKKIIKKLKCEKNNIYYGSHFFNYLFLKNNLVYKLEDGFGSYIEVENKSIKAKIKELIDQLLFLSIFYQKKVNKIDLSDKLANKIYVTEMSKNIIFNKKIKNKIEKINLKELWNQKNKQEKNEILSIFNFDKKLVEKFKLRNVILLTQPLSEDGIITEQEKINIYSKILKNYSPNKMIIKVHPREKTSYNLFFPEVEVIKQDFPIELLELLNIKINIVITLFSSGIFNFSDNVEKKFYGTKVHPNIYKNYGEMDKIFEVNEIL